MKNSLPYIFHSCTEIEGGNHIVEDPHGFSFLLPQQF